MKLPSKPRVLYFSEAHLGPYEYVFERFPSAFKRLGCELTQLDPGIATFETYRNTIESFKADIIFCSLQHPWAVCKVADFLDLYRPTVAINWFQEDPNFVTADLLKASHRFDYWFTQDPRTVPFWPTKAFFSPPAFDESVYFDRHLPRVFDVLYIGNLGNKLISDVLWPYMQDLSQYGKRALLVIDRPMGLPLLPAPLERVLRSSKLRPLWRRLPFWRCAWEKVRDEEEKALAVNRSKISFGMSQVRGPWEDTVKSLFPNYPLGKHGLFFQIKPRLFHGVGAGAMALNDHIPELEDLFVIGKEIVTFEFNAFEDFREKLAWYVAHDSERERIAQAGYERGRKQHTFIARIQQIFDILRQEA